MPKVLVVATSRKTRGGITSVVNAHEKESSGRSTIADGFRHTLTAGRCGSCFT